MFLESGIDLDQIAVGCLHDEEDIQKQDKWRVNRRTNKWEKYKQQKKGEDPYGRTNSNFEQHREKINNAEKIQQILIKKAKRGVEREKDILN